MSKIHSLCSGNDTMIFTMPMVPPGRDGENESIAWLKRSQVRKQQAAWFPQAAHKASYGHSGLALQFPPSLTSESTAETKWYLNSKVLILKPKGHHGTVTSTCFSISKGHLFFPWSATWALFVKLFPAAQAFWGRFKNIPEMATATEKEDGNGKA